MNAATAYLRDRRQARATLTLWTTFRDRALAEGDAAKAARAQAWVERHEAELANVEVRHGHSRAV